MSRVARVAKIAVTALILVLISTGCMRAEFVIELNEDGTGTLSNVFAMTEEAYNLFLENGTDPFEDYTTDKKVIDGVSYVYYTGDLGKMTFKEIEEELLEFIPDTDSDDPIPLFKDVSIKKKASLFKNEYRFKMVTNKDAVTDNETMSASELMTVLVSVKMPGKVISHKVNDNVVNITIDEYSEEKTYEIVSTSSNTLVIGILVLLLFFLIIAVVVVVVIVVVLKKKKDAKVQDSTYTPAAEETDQEL
ncbi:MAG: hypothetical protein GX166_03685 [Clostridiaceae bacterium]|nr:hypothetical protein [Clostridiaceae bacterium]